MEGEERRMFKTTSPTTIEIVQANTNEVQNQDNTDIIQTKTNEVQTQDNRDNIYSKHIESFLSHFTLNNWHRIKNSSLYNM